MTNITINVFSLLFLFVSSSGDNKKRLLVTDDDRFHQMEVALQKMRMELLTVRKGATYTRWGRTTCPGNGTELVYTGIAGGGYYSHSGSAADYVCLPHDPQLITGASLQNPYNDLAYMYGVEYEDSFLGSKLFDNDAPCSVCYTPQQSTILMIPGKRSCYDGWKMEYTGKLASGSYKHPAASQYICLDSSPEVLEHGNADENGKLIYPVKAVCGSLPCPPYTNGALFTCVVCSK